MKKTYSKPDIEVIKLSALADDFLTTSYDPEEEEGNGMGNSQGEIIPGKVPSLH